MSLQQIPGHYVISAPGSVDSATCSAIASAYAESAVSSVSGNYYTTANESGYALSSDVSATVDLVGTQSANWGGSALALSAGPGVKLEKVGDTLVASTDETVLWSGDYSVAATSSLSLSESWKKFEYIKVLGYWNENDTKLFPLTGECYVNPFTAKTGVEIPATTPGFVSWGNASTFWVNATIPCIFTSTTSVKVESSRLVGNWNNAWQAVNTLIGNGHIVKIVGINRTAEA